MALLHEGGQVDEVQQLGRGQQKFPPTKFLAGTKNNNNNNNKNKNNNNNNKKKKKKKDEGKCMKRGRKRRRKRRGKIEKKKKERTITNIFCKKSIKIIICGISR